MTIASTLITALLPVVLTSAPGKWEVATKTDGITVFTRERENSDIGEVKAIGLIKAAPHEVWKAIRDYDNYKKNMPYTEVSQVLSRDEGDKNILFYSVINAPLVDRRDYVIKLRDESDWKDGKGFLKVSWTTANHPTKPITDGIVRVKVNDGYWLLEPRDDGKTTFGTYYVFTDPGGSLPRFIVNKANESAVPDVFRAVRKAVGEK